MRALKAIYLLVLRHQLTRNRIIVVVLLTVLALITGFTVVRNGDDQIQLAVDVVTLFGLGLIIPVVCLLLGSAALGEWVDDETLVYVWLRPVPRWVIAVGAYLAVLTVCLPVNLVPLLGAALAGGVTDSSVLSGAALATIAATIAYCGLFLLLGLTVRKALAFGLLYVFVWEGAVAGLFSSAGRLSVSSYATSMLARITELGGPPDRAEWATWLIPLVIATGGVALTTWRLNRTDVA